MGDLLLVGVAVLIYLRGDVPLTRWDTGAIALCVGAGATLSILPFVLEYRVFGKLAQAEALSDVVSQIQAVQSLAEQITAATARWQSVQEVAERVASTSKAIAERMSAEAKAFTEFQQRANDIEKANLRLEIDKLRRAEGDWVHVLVRMLDHVYALHVGALRSGQPNVIAQLDQFQNACRDVARRIGLTPFAAKPAEPFDAQKHQLLDGEKAPAQGAAVDETIATGYTFQGRLIRPALVRLVKTDETGESGPNGTNQEPAGVQTQLPVETAQKP